MSGLWELFRIFSGKKYKLTSDELDIIIKNHINEEMTEINQREQDRAIKEV